MRKKRSDTGTGTFVLSDVNPHVLEQARQERKILVCGDAVFSTTDSAAIIPEMFSEQVKRQGTAFWGYIGGRGQNLRVCVAKPVLAELPKVRVGFAIDGYLRWGLMRTRRTVLIGGAAGTDNTVIDVLVFEKGRLLEKDGRVLPPQDSLLFAESLQSVIDDIRHKYADARIFQAAPLPDFNLPGVVYLGRGPLSSIAYRPLQATSEISITRSWGPAVVIGMAGLTTYGVFIGTGWIQYQGARSEFKVAIDHPAIRDAGGVDQGYLSIMQQRRLFMEAPRRQMALADKAAEIVRGVAHVDGVRVIEMQMPAPAVVATALNHSGQALIQPEVVAAGKGFSANRQPDVSMSVSVPASKGSVLEQAREVMVTIARETGMDLRLSHQGWREDAAKNRRIFIIEGILP